MTILDLKATRGDTWWWEFTVLQRDRETAQDITGAQFRFTAKYRKGDTDGEAPVTGSTGGGECQVTDAANGLVEVKIPPAQTGSVEPGVLQYDLQATDGSGHVFTVARGRIEVERDISITQP